MKKWFTLVEVLVAIVVIGVGIVWVLGVISRNILAVDRINLENQATILAKEGIEIVYNIKDTNIERWIPWDCAEFDYQSPDCDTYFTWATGRFDVSFDKNNIYELTSTTTWGTVYYNTWSVPGIGDWFWYSQDGSGDEETYYQRYIEFEDVQTSSLNNVLKVKSVVEYSKWAYTWDVAIESFIWKSR